MPRLVTGTPHTFRPTRKTVPAPQCTLLIESGPVLTDLHCLINWEAWTAIGTVSLAVIAGVTALYAKQQLNDFRRESRIAHLISLVDQFEREPMAGTRRTLGAKRAPGGVLVPLDLNNPPPELHDVMNFFEHMGYLLEGGYLNIEDVSVEFHYWILHVWADARKLIKSERTENAIYYEFFEKMVNRLLEYDRPRTGVLQLPTETEIEDIYAEESHLPLGSPIPRAKRSKRRSSS